MIEIINSMPAALERYNMPGQLVLKLTTINTNGDKGHAKNHWLSGTLIDSKQATLTRRVVKVY